MFRRVVLCLLVAAGCGDNNVPKSSQVHTRSSASSVGGAQVARSKSFMLVTSLGNAHQQTAKSRSMTLKSGLMGGE